MRSSSSDSQWIWRQLTFIFSNENDRQIVSFRKEMKHRVFKSKKMEKMLPSTQKEMSVFHSSKANITQYTADMLITTVLASDVLAQKHFRSKLKPKWLNSV